MRRRELVFALGGTAIAWPLVARAQQKAMPVIGFLGGASPGPFAPQVAAFRQGLNEAGYIEGRNVAIEFRWAEGRYDQLPTLAADLISRKVDLIAAQSTPSALAAKTATSTIPIVFTSGDPVGIGLVDSLARPAGNVTGVSFISTDLMAKRFELLSELVPQAGMIALLVNPSSSGTERMVRDVQQAAGAKGVELLVLNAGTEGEIEAAFATLRQRQAGGLLVGADPFLSRRREQLVEQTSRDGVSAVYEWREVAGAGAL